MALSRAIRGHNEEFIITSLFVPRGPHMLVPFALRPLLFLHILNL